MNMRKSNVAKKRRKRGSHRGVIVFFVVLVLLGLICGFAFWYIHSNNPIYQRPEVVSEIGEETKHFEKNENNYINVYYPVFYKTNIDSVIQSKVNEYIQNFKEQNQRYVELTDTTKADLKIGYKSYQVTEDIASVLLTVYQRKEFEENYSTEYYTFVFDLKNDKEILLSDLFKGRYLNYISSLVEERIKLTKSSSDIVYEKLRSALCPTANNFSKFILKEDRIVFYFDKNRFSDSDTNEICSVEISYGDMNGYFKRGYLESKTTQEDYLYDQVNGPVDDRLPTVVLTFDDGPGKNTQKVVEILREYNAVASFFMLGERINYVEPEVLMNLITEGSSINSHSYSHANFKNLTAEQIQQEIQNTTIAIYNVTEYNIRFFRPPYGSYNDFIKENAFFPLVLWSVDPRDWDTDDPNVVYENVINNVSDGDVVLLHEIHDSTVEALPRILEELNHRGYQIVTIEEMVDSLGSKLPRGVVIENN